MINKLKRYLFRSLSLQLIVIIIAGMIITAAIQFYISEEVIEESILDQTKKQAYVFLLGIEREIQSLPDPYSENAINRIFNHATTHDADKLDFFFINVYIFNNEGRVIGYVNKPEHMQKDLSDYYGTVIKEGIPYFGGEIEKHYYNEEGRSLPYFDIIIPVHYQGEVIGGLEVELDLNKTFSIIKNIDDKYEKRITTLLIAALLLLSLITWYVIHRRFILPVINMSNVTGIIASGDLHARINSNSKNELGLLSTSIDNMADSIEDLFNDIDTAYMGILNSLSKALQARDEYTAHHAENVTRYSLLLGRRIGLDEKQLKALAQGAMLHDLGKIGVPDNILKKSGALTVDEMKIIKDHPDMTSKILDPLEKFKHFSEIARYHHERWDGQGYPDRLKGENIPLLARIVSIADSWDAMTGDRVYRKGMQTEKAKLILENEKKGGQWDPSLVEEFIKIVNENDRKLPQSNS